MKTYKVIVQRSNVTYDDMEVIVGADTFHEAEGKAIGLCESPTDTEFTSYQIVEIDEVNNE